MHVLHSYIDNHQTRFLSELAELCRRQDLATNQHVMEETAGILAARLERMGAKTALLAVDDAPPVVYGEMGSGTRTLLIYNHYDVQPPDPLSQWDTPPFEPTIREGKLYARGVADNKGNLMARIHAVEAWQEAVGELPIKIKWIMEGEEEVGSPHLAPWVQEHRRLLEGAEGCLWEFGYKDAAGRQVINLGVKGILYVELIAHGAARDLHSSMAAIVPNPAWRLAWALNSLKDAEDHILIKGFMDRVAPPTAAAMALLQKLPFDEEAVKTDLQIPAFIRNLSGLELQTKYLYEPTCTICGLNSGYIGSGSKTVLPNRAMAKIDFRLVHNLTPQSALELLQEHLLAQGFGDIEIVAHAMNPPAQTDPAHPIVQMAETAVAKTSPQGYVIRPSSAGSGPMYLMTEYLGIPTVSFGVGHDGSNRHAPNENIFLADYIDGIKCAGEFFSAFSETS